VDLLVVVVVVPLGVVAVVVGVEAGVVGVVPVPVTVVVAAAPEDTGTEDTVAFKQLVEPPVWTVNGADCEISPLASRSVMSRLVPTGKLTAVQVNEVPV